MTEDSRGRVAALAFDTRSFEAHTARQAQKAAGCMKAAGAGGRPVERGELTSPGARVCLHQAPGYV